MDIRVENIVVERRIGNEKEETTRKMNNTVPVRTIRKKIKVFGAK